VTRINPDIRHYLDQMIDQDYSILIGDANGADNAIQKYLKSREYQKVEVFCMEGNCRNNHGDWQLREIQASKKKKDFTYFSTKDQQMAKEASIGFMVWDGRSPGTLVNVHRLISKNKKVEIYTVSNKSLSTLKDTKDWEDFFTGLENEIQEQILPYIKKDITKFSSRKQKSLFEITPY